MLTSSICTKDRDKQELHQFEQVACALYELLTIIWSFMSLGENTAFRKESYYSGSAHTVNVMCNHKIFTQKAQKCSLFHGLIFFPFYVDVCVRTN